MAVVLTTLIMASITLVGIAALRMVRPLVSPEDDRTAMVGHRTRVALEREKLLVLRTIKELEFDHAMGKLSDVDYQEMSGRLRSRAGAADAAARRRLGLSRADRAGSREAPRPGAGADRPAGAARRVRRPTTPTRASARAAERSCEPADVAVRADRSCSLGALALVVSAAARVGAGADGRRGGFEMPDMKQMSGIPRPVTDLPNGAVGVRLIRGDLSNNIANHDVELHVGSKVITKKTDDSGHVVFDGARAGHDGQGDAPTSTASTSSRRSSRCPTRAACGCCSSRPTRRRKPRRPRRRPRRRSPAWSSSAASRGS